LPRSINRGTPVTACHARTGLLTAPGIFSRALSKSRFDFVFIIGGVQLASVYQRVKILNDKKKRSAENFFLKRILKRIMSCPSANFYGCCLAAITREKGLVFSRYFKVTGDGKFLSECTRLIFLI
jgi:hypothetical protein